MQNGRSWVKKRNLGPKKRSPGPKSRVFDTFPERSYREGGWKSEKISRAGKPFFCTTGDFQKTVLLIKGARALCNDDADLVRGSACDPGVLNRLEDLEDRLATMGLLPYYRYWYLDLGHYPGLFLH